MITLDYPNKLSLEQVITSAKHIEFEGIRTGNSRNLLILGDNLEVLVKLLPEYRSKIDLVYIDPPFSTNSSFSIDDNRSNSISRSRNGITAYHDKLTGYQYLEFLRQRLMMIREMMSARSSIYLHIDYKIGHYVKVIMDEVFGQNKFRSDISRIKCNPKNFKRKAYGNVKDMILFYTKTNDYIWHEPHEEYTDEDGYKLFRKVDAHGRRYTTIPLHAPGETVAGESSKAFKGILPPRGRHWRCSVDELEKLDAMNMIEWSKNGVPRKIIYLDEMPGKRYQDIWEFKDPQYPKYPTEKSTALLDLIIKTSAEPKSLFLDCFCGSGVSLYQAAVNGLDWIGIDESELAIATVQKRFVNQEISESFDYKFLRAKLHAPLPDYQAMNDISLSEPEVNKAVRHS